MSVHVTFDVPPPFRPALQGVRRVALEKARGVITIVRDRVDARFMDRAPKLQVISQMAVGVDNIQVREATRRGILVCNTPGVLTETTADLAWALILACARGVAKWDRHVRGRKPWGWEPFGFLGHDVQGASLGIIGAGRIGRAVAERAKGFGMEVCFATRAGGLKRVLASDFVSIHCPLTPQTRHLIGRRELRLMKPTAYLVNTARGPVVDEGALAEALKKGWIAGAGLDVYEREPKVHSGLLRLENVVLLPHIGSATFATRRRMLETAVANLMDALIGRRPRHLVNPEALRR